MANLLVIDDDHQSAHIIERMLSRIAGHKIRCTVSGDEAYEFMAGGEAEVVLFDISISQMPFRGETLVGLDLCKALKSDPKVGSIPVLLVTAHAMRGDRERYLANSGADSYFTKPVLDYHALCAAVARLLDARDAELKSAAK